jgi:ABC-type multidrug transport system fused ATPase/permease subunit
VRILRFVQELRTLVRPQARQQISLLVLVLLGEAAALPSAFLFAELIRRVQAGSLVVTSALLLVAIILGLELVSGGLAIIRVRLNRSLSLLAANRLRGRLFRHLLRLPYRFYLERNAGGEASSYLSDVDDVDQAVSGLVESGLRSIVMILIFGAALVVWNPLVGLLALTLLPLTVVAQRQLYRRVGRSSRDKVDIRAGLMAHVAEAVQKILLVKAFSMEGQVGGRAADLSARFHDADVSLESYQSVMRSLSSVVFVFVQYAFFVVGGLLVVGGQLEVAAFLGQLVLVGRFVGPMNDLLQFINTLNRSEAALHRVRDLLALPTEAAPRLSPTVQLPPPGPRGVSLAVSNLRFGYLPGQRVIDDWSFVVEPGQVVAIVGPSGAGKTTLFHLLLGLYDDYAGDIVMNGVEVRQVPLAELREQCGPVFQEHVLFNASMRVNLLVGAGSPTGDAADTSDQKLWDALDLAHAGDFVRELPAGLDTAIGVNGVQLSGGQRQRVALARVMLRDPALLMLDEATSALDSFSEQAIQGALDGLFGTRTSLIVAHRLSTIAHADQIIVVENGRLVEAGSSDELIRADGVFRRLYDAQVAGFLGSGAPG